MSFTDAAKAVPELLCPASGVEQAFEPAVLLLKKSASATEGEPLKVHLL
jgi:hypothetical protein